jgi:lipopolysaccharide transport system ATP-binding protein
MSDVAIRVAGLGKKYRLTGGMNGAGYRSLRETLADSLTGPTRAALARIRGAQGSGARVATDFWALQHVDFEVKHGQVLGIVGRNGAGKSTLLKILSRITEPTEGTIDIYGRVGSLLEVGTGFHHELTGRENIYLNGAILGMRRADIARRFDEIVEFAGIERFLDTPVKHYSSGMYMRLAFAVAAHLEPDIVLVDEVLAVGDAGFQKKCLGKMSEVAREGRTVLFVSHNLGAIVRLCGECLWLEQGQIRMQGGPAEVIGAYTREGLTDQAERRWAAEDAPGDNTLKLRGVRICQPSGTPTATLDITKPFEIEVETEALQPLPEAHISLRLISADGQVVIHTADVMNPRLASRPPGRSVSRCRLPAHALNAGTYVLMVGADVPHARVIFLEEQVLTCTVEPLSAQMSRYAVEAWRGLVGPGIAEWSLAPSTATDNGAHVSAASGDRSADACLE